jgi:hypothetical protein
MPPKKTPPVKEVEAFVEDDNHIYTLIANANIEGVDSGWRKFTFHLVPNLQENGEDCHGSTDFDNYKINLDAHAKDSVARETIMHEITHVILETVGFGANIVKDGGDEKEQPVVASNERITIQMSRGLMMFYKLNPKLAKLLMDREIKGD